MNLKILARFSGLYGAYIGAAVIGRLLDDTFVSTGLMPSDDWQDPVLVGAISVTLISFAWTMFSSAALLTLLARRGFFIESSFSFFRTVELIIIETIRSIAATIIRLPLLILPGIYEWIRLTPVPFLVIFDRDYQAGRIDALKGARELFSKHRWFVVLLLIPVFLIFLAEVAMTASPSDALPVWRAPLQHMGSIILFSALRLACDAFLLSRYRKLFAGQSG